MTEEAQQKIDKLMLDTHQAVRSTVTKKEWISTNEGVWVCGYIHWPKSEKDKPKLHMVHYLNDKGREAFVIYRSIGS